MGAARLAHWIGLYALAAYVGLVLVLFGLGPFLGPLNFVLAAVFVAGSLLVFPVLFGAWAFAMVAAATFDHGRLAGWQVLLSGGVALPTLVVVALVAQNTWSDNSLSAQLAFFVGFAMVLIVLGFAYPALRAARRTQARQLAVALRAREAP